MRIIVFKGTNQQNLSQLSQRMAINLLHVSLYMNKIPSLQTLFGMLMHIEEDELVKNLDIRLI